MRVLIVDDDSSAELTAECLMLDSKISVEIASDGASALKIAAELAPEVILLDVHLPDMSGLDLAPRLKALCPTSDVRIIILSGTSRDDSAQNCPKEVSAWLEKPVHIDTLQQYIRQKGCAH